MMIIFINNNIISNKKILDIKQQKRKEKKKMSDEMVKEFIGKECFISALSGWDNISGKIVAVENGWVKVEEKKKIRIVNLDYIKDISMKKSEDK